MHQKAFVGRALPIPAGELTALPKPHSWIQGVLLLRGREGKCAQFCNQIWVIEDPDYMLSSNGHIFVNYM